MQARLRKKLLTGLKILVSAVLIYFIFTKIDYQEFVTAIRKSKPFPFILGILLVLLSKGIAAVRLNAYFHTIGAKLTQTSNLKLYFQGMFYNLFLPGGIGGDAYKGYVVQKQFQTGTKKAVGVLFLDRLSGMVIICVYILLLLLFIEHPLIENLKPFIVLCIPLGVGAFWFINKYFFSYALRVFWKCLGYSALVQLFQVVCVFFLVKSFLVTENLLEYLVVFLVSSVVSIIPLTIGGFGSREITFLYGSEWLGLDSNISVGVSFLFFIITALISLFGIVYHIKKPNLVVEEH
ncbi:MAG: lysylphosphatidylglycerol synthase transmembrane domain-containing protein [Bacteroidota bacterium]